MGLILDEHMVTRFETQFDMIMDLVERLQEFIESEARSCSMDFGCITPEYVYRSWGGQVPLNEIEQALRFQDSRLTMLTFDTTRHN